MHRVRAFAVKFQTFDSFIFYLIILIFRFFANNNDDYSKVKTPVNHVMRNNVGTLIK